MGIDFANKILGFSRIGGFVGQVFIGFFLDRFSTRKSMFFLVLASGLSTLGLALIHIQWLFLSFLLLLPRSTRCMVPNMVDRSFSRPVDSSLCNGCGERYCLPVIEVMG